MAEQPMGRGVGQTRFERNNAQQVEEARLLEQQAFHKSAQLEEKLLNDPFLSLFIAEMESTMLRIYMEHPEGQVQSRILKRLQIGLDPSVVVKNLIRKRMGAALCAIAETQATP